MSTRCTCGGEIGPRKQPFACFRCDDGSTPLYCLNCAEDMRSGPRKPENDLAYHIQQWDDKMKRWDDMNHHPGTLAVCEEWLSYHTILKQQCRIVRRNDVVVREFGKGAK